MCENVFSGSHDTDITTHFIEITLPLAWAVPYLLRKHLAGIYPGHHRYNFTKYSDNSQFSLDRLSPDALAGWSLDDNHYDMASRSNYNRLEYTLTSNTYYRRTKRPPVPQSARPVFESGLGGHRRKLTISITI